MSERFVSSYLGLYSDIIHSEKSFAFLAPRNTIHLHTYSTRISQDHQSEPCLINNRTDKTDLDEFMNLLLASAFNTDHKSIKTLCMYISALSDRWLLLLTVDAAEVLTYWRSLC